MSDDGNTAQGSVPPIAVRVTEAARLLGISRSALYELIQTGEVRSFKLGRTRLVPVASLNELVETRSSKALGI